MVKATQIGAGIDGGASNDRAEGARAPRLFVRRERVATMTTKTGVKTGQQHTTNITSTTVTG